MDEPLDTDVAIEAPEHIVFRHFVAGPGRRAVAQVLDLIICYAAAILLSVLGILAFSGLSGFKGAVDAIGDASAGIILLVMFAAQWLYSFLWEGITGTSPGKRILGLRVVRTDGRPIGLGASALRNVLRAADALPGAYLVGVTAMAVSRRFQRLGDLVAGTVVVVVGRAGKAAPVVLSPPAQPVELAVLPDVVPLDVDERSAIELFLRRRDALGPARAEELARMVTPTLAARFGFVLPDASRTVALLYDRAVNVGRGEGPPSSRHASWQPSRLGQRGRG